MEVLPIRRLAGWAALVGGTLSGAAVALLFLAPVLGFYPLGSRDPGRLSAGSVNLPVAIEARSTQPAVAAIAPLGRSAVALGPAVTAVPARRTSGAGAPGNGPRRGASSRPVSSPTPSIAPGVSTPAAPPPSTPVVPTAPAMPAEPVAPPAPEEPPQPQQPATGSGSKGGGKDKAAVGDPLTTGSSVADPKEAAKAAREQAKADARSARDEAKAAREAARAARHMTTTTPAVAQPPVAADTPAVTGDQEQGTGNGHGNAWGHNHDGGNGHGSHGRWSGEESDG